MGTKVWVIADPHFSHANIIKYENRPFKDIHHMNESIISNWNNVVSKEDKVFLLGDIGLGKPEDMYKYLSRLNGNLVLILGNHDNKNLRRWHEIGMTEVYKYPIVFDSNFILSHEPVNTNSNFVNIHGHVHSHSDYETWGENRFCACLERHNYTPVDYFKIKNYYIPAVV